MFVRVCKNNKWGFIDPMSGKSIDCIYHDVHNFDGNYAVVMDDSDKYGVIDSDGRTVLPFLYTRIKRNSEGLFRIYVNCITCLRNVDGLLLNDNHEPLPDNCQKYDVAFPINEGLYLVGKDERIGVISGNKVILPCKHYHVSLLDRDFFIVQADKYGYRGMVDMEGKSIIPEEYDEIGRLDDGLYYGKHETCWDIYSSEGQLICHLGNYFRYKVTAIDKQKDNLFKIAVDDSFLFADLREGTVYPLGPDNNKCFKLEYDYYTPLQNGCFEVTKNGRMGVLDEKGDIIIPCEYSDISYHGDLAYLKIVSGKYIGLSQYKIEYVEVYDFNNRVLLTKKQYTEVSEFHEGYAIVKQGYNGFGVINSAGAEVIPTQYKVIQRTDDPSVFYAEDYSCGQFYNISGKLVFKKEDGEYQIAPGNVKRVFGFSDGLVRILDSANNYGFMDDSGRIVIPCRYPSSIVSVSDFENGESSIRLSRDCDKNETCSIDKKGRFIADTKEGKQLIENENLVFVYPFDDYPVAIAVDNNSKYGLVSIKGEAVSAFIYDNIKPFDNLQAIVRIGDHSGVIGTDGSLIIPVRFKKLFPEGKYYRSEEGLLDRKGHFVAIDSTESAPLIPQGFVFDTCLSDNLYVVAGTGGRGVIDDSGRFIIPASYDTISLIDGDKNHILCQSGLSVDCLGHPMWRNAQFYNLAGEKVIINGEHEYHFNEDYESYGAFLPNGLAPVMKNSLWGFIDGDLREIIKCQFCDYHWREDGYCLVTVGNQSALIDTRGEYVLAPGDYLNIGIFNNGLATITMHGFYHYGDVYTEYDEGGNEYSHRSIIQDERLVDTLGRLVVSGKEGTIYLDKKYKWFITNPDESISVYDGQRWGLLDKRGNVQVTCSYLDAFCYNGQFAIVHVENGVGLINTKQQFVLEPVYDNVHDHSSQKTYYAVKGNTVSIYDQTVRFVASIECEEFKQLSDNVTRFRRQIAKKIPLFQFAKYGFINHSSGKEYFGYDVVAQVSDDLILVEKNYRWGFVTCDGETVIPCIYYKANPFIGGRAIVAQHRPDQGCFLKKQKHNADNYVEGIIGKTGEEIVPLVYQELKYVKESDHQVLAANFEGVHTFLDRDGTPLSKLGDIFIPIPGYYACGEKVADGRVIVYGEKGIGVADTRGHLAFPCRVFGDIAVSPDLNEEGGLSINGQDISGNHISMDTNNNGCLITKNGGQALSLPFKYILAKKWVGNYIPVVREGAWGVLDKEFNEVIPCIYDDVQLFGSRALVLKNKAYSIIGLVDDSIIELPYKDVSILDNDLLKVSLERSKDNGRSRSLINFYSSSALCYGLIDKYGQVLIEPSFDEVSLEDDYKGERDEDNDEDIHGEPNEDSPTYRRYTGTYAQDEAGWSDQMIDDALDGDPDAYWNIG